MTRWRDCRRRGRACPADRRAPRQGVAARPAARRAPAGTAVCGSSPRVGGDQRRLRRQPPACGFRRMPYLRSIYPPMGLIAETFESAVTWAAWPAFHDGVTGANPEAARRGCAARGRHVQVSPSPTRMCQRLCSTVLAAGRPSDGARRADVLTGHRTALYHQRRATGVAAPATVADQPAQAGKHLKHGAALSRWRPAES